MFKKGDKVVCIDNYVVSYDNGLLHKSKYLELNKSYIIDNPNGGGNDLKLENIEYYYKWGRFVPIEKHRLSKLKKIISEIER